MKTDDSNGVLLRQCTVKEFLKPSDSFLSLEVNFDPNIDGDHVLLIGSKNDTVKKVVSVVYLLVSDSNTSDIFESIGGFEKSSFCSLRSVLKIASNNKNILAKQSHANLFVFGNNAEEFFCARVYNTDNKGIVAYVAKAGTDFPWKKGKDIKIFSNIK